jgi:hypothetical protein
MPSCPTPRGAFLSHIRHWNFCGTRAEIDTGRARPRWSPRSSADPLFSFRSSRYHHPVMGDSAVGDSYNNGRCMRLYCEKCQALRDTVFKCVEATGRVLLTCAFSAMVLIAPADHPHGHDPEPTGPQPNRTITIQSTGTISPGLSTPTINWPWPPKDST